MYADRMSTVLVRTVTGRIVRRTVSQWERLDAPKGWELVDETGPEPVNEPDEPFITVEDDD